MQLKSNLQQIANERHPTFLDSNVTEAECYYEESIYQAKSCSLPRKVIIKSIRLAGELFFNHSFVVTNFVDAFSPQDIFLAYQKREARWRTT